MVKFSRGKVIVFDIDEALSFEGESGPYLQYAVVRANNIFNKLEEREGLAESAVIRTVASTPADAISGNSDEAADLWNLVLEAARLDEIVEQAIRTLELSVLAKYAFGLAQAFNTITTAGTAATGGGGAEGLSADISHLKPGNDVLLTYTQNGAGQRVRIVNSTNGEDFVDASGQRVISVDLSNATTAAATLQAKLPGLAITSPSAGVLQVLDDGTGGIRDVTGLTTRGSATGMQQGDLAMALFVDQGNSAFTDNLDTDPPQIVGFAARISVNPAVVTDNRLLVQYDIDHTLGDAARPEYILDQLNSMSFVSGTTPAANEGRHQLNGTVEPYYERPAEGGDAGDADAGDQAGEASEG